ncbi:MAG: PAS domain-containing protein, partial [Planctomycetota bacterium]
MAGGPEAPPGFGVTSPAADDTGGPDGQVPPVDPQPDQAQRSRPVGLHIERTTRGVKWLLFGRLGVALFIIAYVLISTRGWGRNWADKTVYAIVTGVLVLNVAYLIVLKRVRKREGFVHFQIAVDIAVETALVFLTGGVSSQIVVLFMLSIMSASLLLSWRAAVTFASEAAVLHAGAAMLHFVFVMPRAAPSAMGGLVDILPTLFLQVLAFFSVALLSGLLAARLAVARLLSRDILEAIGQGLIVADGRGRILFSNDEARRMLGEEAVAAGSPLDEALPPQARE